MIKFSNYATTKLLQPFMAADTTCHVDTALLGGWPSVDANDQREGVFFIIEDVYGRFEACYANEINGGVNNTGTLKGCIRGLGGTPAYDWDDLNAGPIRVEIRPSAEIFQRLLQRDGDIVHGGWWDGQDGDPWATPPRYANHIITKHNHDAVTKDPEQNSLMAGELAVDLDKKTLWVGNRDGVTVPVQGSASNVINVMNEGAKGNWNVATQTGDDDTDAIQKAIYKAIERNACLFFPAGTYKVTDVLRVEPEPSIARADPGYSLSIKGCGMRSTRITGVGTGPWAIFYVIEPKYFNCEDMTLSTNQVSSWAFLDGPKLPTDFENNPLDNNKGSSAIYIKGEHAWAGNHYRWGSEYVVDINSVEFTSHDHAHKSGWAFGVALDTTGNATIRDCVFTSHIRSVAGPAYERGGMMSGVCRFGNTEATEDTLISGCTAVGCNTLASCKGYMSSMVLLANFCDLVGRLFTSFDAYNHKSVHIKFLRVAGNVVNSYWAFLSAHSVISASIVGNYFTTLGVNTYPDKNGVPLPRYNLLSISAFRAIIDGNYLHNNDTQVTEDTDIYGISVFGGSREVVISNNTISLMNLGMWFEIGSRGCERHGNIYRVNANRIVTGTDGKVLDESEDNVKPVGGVMLATVHISDTGLAAGDGYLVPFESKHIDVNEIGCTVEEGFIVLGKGIERVIIEGLLRIGDRGKVSEVQGQLVKRKDKNSGPIEVAARHYYGKSAATLTPSRVYINNPDHDARFNIRIVNNGPEPIVLRAPMSLRFTVLGYEE